MYRGDPHRSCSRQRKQKAGEAEREAKLSEKARGRGRYASNNLLVKPPRSAQYCINTALEGVAVLLITSGPTLAENTKPALD